MSYFYKLDYNDQANNIEYRLLLKIFDFSFRIKWYRKNHNVYYHSKIFEKVITL